MSIANMIYDNKIIIIFNSRRNILKINTAFWIVLVILYILYHIKTNTVKKRLIFDLFAVFIMLVSACLFDAGYDDWCILLTYLILFVIVIDCGRCLGKFLMKVLAGKFPKYKELFIVDENYPESQLQVYGFAIRCIFVLGFFWSVLDL